jgi:hypothetical protein
MSWAVIPFSLSPDEKERVDLYRRPRRLNSLSSLLLQEKWTNERRV